MSRRIRRVTASILTACGLLAIGSVVPDGVARADSAVTTPLPPLTCGKPIHPRIPNCTVTAAYWRNHPESWSRVESITLGQVSYDQVQLLTILDHPPRRNGLVQLAHQLIAAKLNVMLGAEPPAEVAAAITRADALIGSLVVLPIGSDNLPLCRVWPLVSTLRLFNEGFIGPGRCPHAGGITPASSPTWGALKTIYR